MLTTLRSAAITATLFVIGAFVMMFVAGLRGLSEVLLEPGYALPRACWGAVHDVLQLFLVVFLDLVFYTVVLAVVIWGWRRIHR